MGRPKTGKTTGEKEFREILMEYRKKNGYTQDKFAQVLGIDQSGYSKFENGKMQFSAKRMLDIAEKLDLKNKIINPLNFAEFKKQAVKLLRIPILNGYPQNEKELEEYEQKANKYLFFDLSFFPNGSFYAVENPENLTDIEKGEYVILTYSPCLKAGDSAIDDTCRKIRSYDISCKRRCPFSVDIIRGVPIPVVSFATIRTNPKPLL